MIANDTDLGPVRSWRSNRTSSAAGALLPAVGHEARGLVAVATALLVESTPRFPGRVRRT